VIRVFQKKNHKKKYLKLMMKKLKERFFKKIINYDDE